MSARPHLRALALGLLALVGGIAIAHAHAHVTPSVSGRIVMAHQDAAYPAVSRYQPMLETSHGLIALHLRSGLSVAPGSRVVLRDPTYASGAIVSADLARLGPPTVGPPTTATGPADFSPGPRTVLVLVVPLVGQPAVGDEDSIRNIVFTAPNSANAFLQQESFGQISLTGKLRSDGDVFTVAPIKPLNTKTCDDVLWGNQAENEFVSATSMDPDSWDHVMFVFDDPACTFSGEAEIGQLPGSAARHTWINASQTNGVPTTSVLAHELGHNLGVDHAGGFNCGTGASRISFSEACAATETTDPTLKDQYQDPFDVMGSGAHEENAYHRWESGWLPPSSAQTVVRNGTYLLAPEETASRSVQLFEVPRGAGLPSYWLDFRQPLNGYFDTFLPTDPVTNGVSIRYANSSTMFHPSKSWLIDTTPATPSFNDAPLAVGQTYTDAARGVSITTVSVSPLGALVKISVANGADTTPPGYPSGLGATLSDGALHLGWTAAPDDSGDVQHYLVRKDGALLADVYDTTAVDPSPAPGQTSNYDITAIDPAGNVGGTSRIAVSVGDTTPPNAPTGLVAGVNGTGVDLSWTPASDNLGVAYYRVDRDGQTIATGLHATSLTDANVPAGTHNYTVRAVDGYGNVGPAAGVTVVVVVHASQTAVPPKLRVKTVTSLKLRRLGKHRVLVSWKPQKGAHRYQVLRAAPSKKQKKTTLLATIKKVQYVDGHAPTGKLVKSRYVVRAVLN